MELKWQLTKVQATEIVCYGACMCTARTSLAAMYDWMQSAMCEPLSVSTMCEWDDMIRWIPHRRRRWVNAKRKIVKVIFMMNECKLLPWAMNGGVEGACMILGLLIGQMFLWKLACTFVFTKVDRQFGSHSLALSRYFYIPSLFFFSTLYHGPTPSPWFYSFLSCFYLQTFSSLVTHL